MPTKLRRYQRKGVKLIRKCKGRTLLADEMGLGKTLQALTYGIKYKKYPIIVICPATLKYTWEDEVRKHFRKQAEVLEGMSPSKRKRFSLPSIVILNYEILKPWIPFLIRLKPKLLILDEVHRIKNMKTKTYKNVKLLASGGAKVVKVRRQQIKRVLALSGTPLTNRPAELWPTLNLLWPEYYPSFRPFGVRYCKPKWTRWGWDYSGAARLPELHRKLKRRGMIRRLKKDVLKDLPPKSRSIVPIQLSLKNRREYQEALENFRKWIHKVSPKKAKRALKAEAVVKIGYLSRLVADLKMKDVFDWIDDFLAESNQKLVLAGVHRKVLDAIFQRYKKQAVLVTGKVKGRKRQLAVRRFQNDPKIRLFVGNIKAAGVGITLTAAATLAFLEMGWTPGEHTQMEDRIHRFGQKKKAMIYYLLASETVETKKYELIGRKQKDLAAILDGGDMEDSFDMAKYLIKALTKRRAA